jgi:hypothetical protein
VITEDRHHRLRELGFFLLAGAADNRLRLLCLLPQFDDKFLQAARGGQGVIPPLLADSKSGAKRRAPVSALG